MDREAIVRYVTDTFPGVDISTLSEGPGAGDTFFIYDPEHDLEPRHQMPFATIVTHHYPGWDTASQLDRPGVYRLNIGVGQLVFRDLFGASSGGRDEISHYDYTVLDVLLPHPVYAAQWWVSVLNPSEATFRAVQPLLAGAYEAAARRHAARRATPDS